MLRLSEKCGNLAWLVLRGIEIKSRAAGWSMLFAGWPMLFMAGPGVLVIRAVPAKRAQAPARGRRVRSRSKPAASSRQNFDLSRVGACPGAGNLGVNPRVLSAACPIARWISRMRQAPRRLSSPGRRVFPMPLVSPGTVA